MMMSLILLLAVLFVLAPIAQAYARRLSGPDVPPGLHPGDVARLREEVEALAAQVNRLQDEQSFMLRLMTEGEKQRLEEGSRTRREPGPPADEPPATDPRPGDK